jgi:hypothetical protein
MRSRIVILVVCLAVALLGYAYSAEVGAAAVTAQNHVESATTALPGWGEAGYAVYAD